jgi:hypothetical protein
MSTMAEPLSPRAAARRNDRLRALLLLALLLLILVAGALLTYLRPHSTGQRIGVGDVLTLAKDKRVVTATIRDEDSLVVGQVSPGRGLITKGGRFSAELPANGTLTASLTALLAATGAHVDVDHQSGKDHARMVLTSLLPVLALTDLVALVLLTSPYAERFAAPHGHRGRHDLPAVLPPATSEPALPAVAVEAQPEPVERPAARKAPPRKRTPTKAVPAAPTEAQPRKAAPAKRAAKPIAAKTTTRRAAPAKAKPAEDVLPVRPTRRRTES